MLKYFAFIVSCFWVCSSYAEEAELPQNLPSFTIITCATSGIGQAIATHLAAKKTPLILIGRNTEKLGAMAAEFKAKYQSIVRTYAVDFALPGSLDRLNNWLKELKRHIQSVILITPRPEYATELLPNPEQILKMVNLCFAGPLQVLKFAKSMFTSNAKVVVVSGLTSKETLPSYSGYGILRMMWVAEAKALSHQWGPDGVQVNTISPGIVMTASKRQEMSRKAEKNGMTYEKQLENDAATVPLRKYADPEDIAKTVAFLISCDNTHISGVNIVIDGGYHKSY